MLIMLPSSNARWCQRQIKIQPPRVSVDLDRDPVLGACCKNCFHVRLIIRSAQQLPAGHVTEDSSARFRQGTQDTICFLLAAQLETAVNACHDKIKLRQNVVWVIQGPFGKYVGLDPLENTEGAAVTLVQAIGLGMLLNNFITG
jgi:hypothetical protein